MPPILIHGIPTGPSLWRHVLPRIEGARCLSWERVGYAGSTAAGRDRDISVATQSEYLVAWMDALEFERVVLAGHDLAGASRRSRQRGTATAAAFRSTKFNRSGRLEVRACGPPDGAARVA